MYMREYGLCALNLWATLDPWARDPWRLNRGHAGPVGTLDLPDYDVMYDLMSARGNPTLHLCTVQRYDMLYTERGWESRG